MSTGTQPPVGGAKSALKIAIPLVALVGVVFGLTYIMQYTPQDPKKINDDPTKRGATSNEPPLRFFSISRLWDPPQLDAEGYRNLLLLAPSVLPSGTSLPNRVFQGVYEPSQDQLRRTQFWFENRNPKPVSMQLKGLSCSACTGGRVAAIPPKTTSLLHHHAALSALPIGAFNPFGVGLSQPLAGLTLAKPEGDLVPLQWTEYGFDADPNATFHVPAAGANADGWSPQWGILELKFKVLGQPGDTPKPLGASFATQVEGTSQVGAHDFFIGFEVAWPFMLSRPTIDVGRLDPLSGDHEYEMLVYSATRGPGSEFGDLEKPTTAVGAPAGITDPVKFIEVTKIERLPDDALPEVAERLAVEMKRLAIVRSAYKVTVVVRPKVGETRMDIGLLERTIAFTAGGVTAQLPVKGTVRGSVWLEGDRTDFELGTFRGGSGTSQTIELVTEKTGIELGVVKGECSPSKFTYELDKQPDRGGRGYYKLKVTVPPGQAFGTVKGVIVLEVKGPNPQRIRIPFKGTGTL